MSPRSQILKLKLAATLGLNPSFDADCDGLLCSPAFEYLSGEATIYRLAQRCFHQSKRGYHNPFLSTSLSTDKDRRGIGWRLGITNDPEEKLPANIEFHLRAYGANRMDLTETPDFKTEAGRDAWFKRAS